MMAAMQELGEREAGDHVSWGWEVLKSRVGLRVAEGSGAQTSSFADAAFLAFPAPLHSHAQAISSNRAPFVLRSSSDAAGCSRCTHMRRAWNRRIYKRHDT